MNFKFKNQILSQQYNLNGQHVKGIYANNNNTNNINNKIDHNNDNCNNLKENNNDNVIKSNVNTNKDKNL